MQDVMVRVLASLFSSEGFVASQDVGDFALGDSGDEDEGGKELQIRDGSPCMHAPQSCRYTAALCRPTPRPPLRLLLLLLLLLHRPAAECLFGQQRAAITAAAAVAVVAAAVCCCSRISVSTVLLALCFSLHLLHLLHLLLLLLLLLQGISTSWTLLLSVSVLCGRIAGGTA